MIRDPLGIALAVQAVVGAVVIVAILGRALGVL